jgi:hypothetical protein
MKLIIAEETKARLARFGRNKLFGDYDKGRSARRGPLPTRS